jgi:hypothetical protein
VAQFLSGDALDFDSVPKEPPTVANHGELLAAFTSSTEHAQSYLTDLSDERAMATWRLMAGGLPASARRAGAIGVRAYGGREPICNRVIAVCEASRASAVGCG